MKKFFLSLALLPFFLVANNLVPNPGFEEDPFDTGWVQVASTLSETTDAKSGAKACNIVSTAKNKGIKSKEYITGSAGLHALSAWIKAEAGLEMKVQISLETTNGNQTINDKFFTTGEWQHMGVSFNCEASDQFKITIATASEAGTFILDDVEVLQYDSPLNADFQLGFDTYWADVLKNGAEANYSDEADGDDIAAHVTVTKTGGSVGDVQLESFSLFAFDNKTRVVSFKAKSTPTDANEVPTAGIGCGYKNIYGKHVAGENNYGGIFDLTKEYRTYQWAIGTTDYDKYFFSNLSLRFGPALGDYYVNDVVISDYEGAPAITSTAIEDAKTNNEYNYQVTTDATAPIGKWGLNKPTGLEFLTIDQYTGLVSGIPDTIGVFDITAHLHTGVDSIGQAFTLTVTEGTSSITDVEDQKLDVYPTVTTGWLTINSDSPILDVQVYALSGQRINNITLQGNRINISHLQSGIYIVKANNLQSLVVKQ